MGVSLKNGTMSKVHLVIPDQHAHPDFNNDRADYLACLIRDLKPDVVINIGDAADMPSLASYDKGKRAFAGRSYLADINSHLEFQDRLWSPVKAAKKKLPYRVILEGNHEHRIEKALDLSPELEGNIGFQDYDFDTYYDRVIRYAGGTPGILDVDGVSYAHYHLSGIMGKSVGGERPAATLLGKKFKSCTQGHTHTFDYTVRTDVDGKHLHGLVCGVYQDYRAPWAGEVNNMWYPGVAIKRNVENGHYDLQWVSLAALKKEYSGKE